MFIEVKVLALAALWQCVQFLLMAIPVNMELGTKVTMSSRDADKLEAPIEKQVSVRTARLIRANNNHSEALILFAIAVVALTLTEQSSAFTQICAWAYLLARVLYVPAYAFDWVPWRTCIWAIGFFSTVLILLAAVF